MCCGKGGSSSSSSEDEPTVGKAKKGGPIVIADYSRAMIEAAKKTLLEAPEAEMFDFLRNVPKTITFDSLRRNGALPRLIALPRLKGGLGVREKEEILTQIPEYLLYENLVEREDETEDGEVIKNDGAVLGTMIQDEDAETQQTILKQVHSKAMWGSLLEKDIDTLKEELGSIETRIAVAVLEEFPIKALLKAIKKKTKDVGLK